MANLNYKHVESVWEDFRLQNLGEYSDPFANSNTLLLADVSENFGRKYLKIYRLAHFLAVPGLA